MTAPLTVYTVGHSNQSMERFLDLLRQYKIEVLVDVRSAPYSRYVPHFNQRELQAAITDAGLRYVYLGVELGGRPADESLYDAEGHARYDLIAQTELFRSGIERVLRGAAQYCVALMCSEEDPSECHRRLLVARVLSQQGVDVQHIRGDAHLDAESDLPQTPMDLPRQPSLFGADAEEPVAWRSIRSVLPRSPQSSSSTS